MSMLAPGFGLLRDVIIDQHFAERGRIGRILGALALNPRLLGLGMTRTLPSSSNRSARSA
jgi:cyanophycinase-like exopeptidase